MFANERDNKNYDIFVGGWFSDYNDPLDFLNVMKTGVYDSYGLYSNSEYDSLIDSLTGENDNAKRLEIYQKLEDLLDGHALRDGHLHLLPVGGAGAQAVEQGPVIHVRVHHIGALGNLIVPAGHGGKEPEQDGMLNMVVGLQLIHHAAEVILILHRDGGRGGGFVQSQHIVGHGPSHRRQHHGDGHYHHKIDNGVGQRRALGLVRRWGVARRSGSSGRRRLVSRCIAYLLKAEPTEGSAGSVGLIDGLGHGPHLALLGEDEPHPGIQRLPGQVDLEEILPAQADGDPLIVLQVAVIVPAALAQAAAPGCQSTGQGPG